MSDNKIEINELDFLTIKDNLKSYLSGRSEFSDFNFEGSGISVLLDLLAYTTHYLGFYNNMVANEMFLDSAIKRTSVISHAKALGYTPTSATSASATVDITITNDSSSTTTLTKRTKFTTSKDGTTYTFYNTDAETFEVLNTTQKIARNVILKEGTYRNYSHIVDNSTDAQRFIIPDKNADTNTLNVYVQTSVTDSTGYSDTWSKVTDITSLTSTSKSYWVQETPEGQFEVLFGDNILSKKPDSGNVVILEYLVCSGRDANDIGAAELPGSRAFSSSAITDTPADIAVVSASSGGSSKESIKSIKWNAPRSFQSQNRSVTSNDYKSYITQNFSKASDVFVWGGEDNDPPEYGKVFASVNPTSGTSLSINDKLSLQNLLKSQNVVSIIPEIVDPNYLYILVESNIKYDAEATTKSSSDIKLLVEGQILAWTLANLEKFSRNMRFSKFCKFIDDADDSILGNDTNLKLQKHVELNLNSVRSYTIKFENPIYHPHEGHKPVISSSTFGYTKTDGTVVDVFIDDDGNGTIRLFEVIGGVNYYISENIGTVDYSKGIVSIKDLFPLSVGGDIFKINAVPANKDILSERNVILKIDAGSSDSIEVTVESYDPYSAVTAESSTGLGEY
ncbi:MAG: hypothetical protein H8D80_01825 [Proteobacteria bacterium]|nr:hypothetical protein [Pseudomonadota bacterium]